MPLNTDAHARRERVRDVLVADLDALVATVEADLGIRMSTPDPLARRLTSEGVRLVEWLVKRWLDLWVGGGSTTTGADLERVREAGTRSAREDLDLDRLLRAWRLTPRSIVETVQGAVGSGLEPLDVLDLANLMLDASHQLTEVFEISYRAERVRGGRESHGARTQLIQDILAGNQGSPRTIEERSTVVGLPLPSDPVVFAVVVDQAAMQPPDSGELEELVAEHRKRRREQGAATLATWGAVYSPTAPGHARAAGIGVVIVDRDEARALCTPIAERGWYAAASQVPSWAECARTFKRVRLALAAAPHWAMVDRHVLREGDVRVLEMLREPGPEPAAGVARSVLGPLLEPDQAPVLAAVQAFLAEGSAPLAARRLLVHPQTLRRRLALARELTGRNLQSSWDRFVLDFATTVASAAP